MDKQKRAVEYFIRLIDIKDRSTKLDAYKENAYFNIAAIKLGQKKYKEAIAYASRSGTDGDKTIEKPLLEKLKKEGLIYDFDAHISLDPKRQVFSPIRHQSHCSALSPVQP